MSFPPYFTSRLSNRTKLFAAFSCLFVSSPDGQYNDEDDVQATHSVHLGCLGKLSHSQRRHVSNDVQSSSDTIFFGLLTHLY